MSAKSEEESATGLVGLKIGIKRFGSSVAISLQCAGDYQAMELYDRLVEAMSSGTLTIDLKAR
jgi:hypothetical protein